MLLSADSPYTNSAMYLIGPTSASSLRYSASSAIFSSVSVSISVLAALMRSCCVSMSASSSFALSTSPSWLRSLSISICDCATCDSALVRNLCISSLAVCITGDSVWRTSSILASIVSSRSLSAGICTVRILLTTPASLVRSWSTVVVASLRTCATSPWIWVILSRWPLTQVARAVRVLPPNSPSLVTPIMACPALICPCSDELSWFVTRIISSSSCAICSSKGSTPLESASKFSILDSYSLALCSKRKTSACILVS